MKGGVQELWFYIVLGLIVLVGVIALVVYLGGIGKEQASGFWGMLGWILGNK
ncbi:MAG: hypothetical protein HZB67_00795 [Candidatus Aenigmarchaeota archaeon]|nr:hypothetical protein [Candidatus Aenigmarchaeota archaeon]